MAITNKNEEIYLCKCGTKFLIVREANSAWIGEIKSNNSCVVTSRMDNVTSFHCPKCSTEIRYYCPLSPINSIHNAYDQPVTAKDMRWDVGYSARYFNQYQPNLSGTLHLSSGKYIDIKGLSGATYKFKRIDKITVVPLEENFSAYAEANLSNAVNKHEPLLRIEGDEGYGNTKLSTKMTYQEIKKIAGPIGFVLPKPSLYFNKNLITIGGKDGLAQIRYACKNYDFFYISLLREDQSLITGCLMGYIETTQHWALYEDLKFLGIDIPKTMLLHFCNGVPLSLDPDKISKVKVVSNTYTKHTEVLYPNRFIGPGEKQHRFIVREPAHHITRILKLAGNKNF